MVMAAPNSTILIDKFMKNLDARRAKKTLNYLKYHKLIEVRYKNGAYEYRLTRKGLDRFEKIRIEELVIPTPKRWDGKWRLVLFDIPIQHRQKRESLLFKLRDLDFYMLQHSAWIHPFDCEKQIGTLLEYLDLTKHVSFLVVNSGNFTSHAEKHFKRINLLI